MYDSILHFSVVGWYCLDRREAAAEIDQSDAQLSDKDMQGKLEHFVFLMYRMLMITLEMIQCFFSFELWICH